MAEVLRPNPLVRTVRDAADVYGLSSGFSDLSVGSTTTTTTTATTTPGQGAQKGAENYVIRLPRRAYSYTEQFAGSAAPAGSPQTQKRLAAAAPQRAAEPNPSNCRIQRHREAVALAAAAAASPPLSSTPSQSRTQANNKTPEAVAATAGIETNSGSNGGKRPALPAPQRSYSVMDEEPVPLTQRPGSALTLPDLPPELHYAIFDFLDPIDSTCLGLTSRQFYAVHRRMHGTVSLGARREGPNDMEWVWRHAGPFVSSSSSSSTAKSHSARNSLAVLSPRGQVYCRKCRTARCELHKHIRDWINGVEGRHHHHHRHAGTKRPEMQYCEVSQKFGRAADDGAPPVCYRSSPRHPHRCGRHTRQQRAVRLT